MALVMSDKLPRGLDYHHIATLRHELKLRVFKNPLYSLRAFSSFLGLHPSALSRLLSGQQEISIKTAYSVTAKLKFSRGEAIRFVSSAICARHHSELSAAALELDCEISELSIVSPFSDCE